MYEAEYNEYTPGFQVDVLNALCLGYQIADVCGSVSSM